MPGYDAKRGAFVGRVEAQCVALIDEQARVRKAGDERTLARHAERVAAGGYVRSVEARRARIVDSMASLPPGAQTRAIEVSQLLEDELARLVCAKPEVFIVETGETAMEVHPGSYLILTGCEFGLRTGQVWMHLTHTGANLALTPRHWDPDTILVEVPDVTGVVDQDVLLHVVTNLGKQSDSLRAELRAVRDVQVAFGAYLSAETNRTHLETSFGVPDLVCAVTTGTLETRWRAVDSITAYHKQYGDLYPSSGRDLVNLQLVNGWTLDQLLFDSWGASSAGAEDGVVTDFFMFQPVRPTNPPGTQPTQLRVYWWVDKDASWVQYVSAFILRGPRGVPYAEPFSQELLDQVMAAGYVPGLPCE